MRDVYRLLPYFVAVFFALPGAFASDIADPYDPLRFKSQDDLLRSLKTIGRVFREIPFDLYRCVGLLAPDGWTGRVIRRNPELAVAMERIFTYRTSSQKSFERLCFTNDSGNYGGIINADHGVCAGITTMNWLANYLALFDETGKTYRAFHPEFKIPKGYTVDTFGALIARKAKEAKESETFKRSLLDPEEEYFPLPKKKLDREERLILDFYTPFINRIFRDNEPTVFPYFTTLESFSDHPALKSYLLKLSVEAWYDVSVSFSSLWEMIIQGGKGNILTAKQVYRLDEQVQAYLRHRIQPIIFIHLEDVDGTGKSIHILRVTNVKWEESADRYVMEMVDPNFEAGADLHKLVINKITTRPDAVEAVYEPYRDIQTKGVKRKRIISLNDVEIAPFFDRISAKTMASWRNWFEEEGDTILERLRQTASDKDRKLETSPLLLPAPRSLDLKPI